MTKKRAYGSGSIIERRGDYYGKFWIGGRQVLRRLGRKRVRGEAGGLTRKQAEELLRQHMAAAAAEATEKVRADSDLTIEAVGRRYIEHAREFRDVKESTLTEYDSSIRIHLAPFFGPAPVETIDAELIESFAAHLRNKPGRGRRGRDRLHPKTVRNQLGTLAVFLNFAVRKKWIASSPMTAVDLPAERNDAPLVELKFLEPEEVARLVDNARPGSYHLLDRALYLLATHSGLRQGELRGLYWRHVDFERAVVHVLDNVTRGRRSSPKGKRRRPVPLAPPAADALRAVRASSHWTAADDPVFATPSTGRPMSVTQLMERYREALMAARLPTGFVFHDLRHTFGTTMARAGVPATKIQGWMGHADLQTTQLYMHYAPAHRDAATIAAAFAFAGTE